MTIIEPVIPKETPPEYEYLADPPSVSSLDLYEKFNFLQGSKCAKLYLGTPSVMFFKIRQAESIIFN